MDKGESVTFNYTGAIQEWIVPNSGIYQLECWASQGGNIYGSWPEGDLNQRGGYGGYVKGYKKLKRNDRLYIGVANQPITTTKDYIWAGGSTWRSVSGGYNGGGNGGGYNTAPSGGGYRIMGAGGGASHIALNSNRGVLSQYNSYRDEVLLVAGGGAGAFEWWEPDGINYGDGSAGGTGGGASFGQGSGWSNSVLRGGGGGGYIGGSSGNGGTNNVDNVPAITFGGQVHSPIMQNGQKSGNGQVIITLLRKTTVYQGDNEADALYEGDNEIDAIYAGDNEA